MTKTELINQIAEDTSLTKIDAGKVIDVTINTIIDAVKDGQKVSRYKEPEACAEAALTKFSFAFVQTCHRYYQFETT